MSHILLQRSTQRRSSPTYAVYLINHDMEVKGLAIKILPSGKLRRYSKADLLVSFATCTTTAFCFFSGHH